MSISSPGKFITFEGIDGCGKSTQAERLKDGLEKRGVHVIFVREPGGTKVSEAVRSILLNREHIELEDRTEALLMTAARAQVTREVIIPALKQGSWVIADRYTDSTLAYQGGGRALDFDWLVQLNTFATYGLVPDLTFFVDVLPDIGESRMKQNRDRIEKEGNDFQTRVRQKYLELLDLYPERIVALDGHRSINDIWNSIEEELIRRHFI